MIADSRYCDSDLPGCSHTCTRRTLLASLGRLSLSALQTLPTPSRRELSLGQGRASTNTSYRLRRAWEGASGPTPPLRIPRPGIEARSELDLGRHFRANRLSMSDLATWHKWRWPTAQYACLSHFSRIR
jgi:hypothetical protein